MTGKKRFLFLGMAVLFALYPAAGLRAQGHFEVGFHYGQWTLDLVKSAIEGAVGDAIKTDLRDKFMEEVHKDHPHRQQTSYAQDITFDSGGDNWGFDIRWFPAGNDAAFSVGLALEKVNMRVSLTDISIKMGFEDDVTHETGDMIGNAAGDLRLKPLAFLANVRWELSPGSKVRPFIVFGLGATGGSTLENAVFSYQYSGEYGPPGEPHEHYAGADSKTGQELKDQAEAEGEDFSIPSVLPFVQLEFGIAAAVHKNVVILVNAGILDGFVLRAGIGVRI
jgi:hypothetical protein